MVEEEQDDVDDVLLVDADDLELREQQVGQRHGLLVSVEPVRQLERVAHDQAADEDVGGD